MSVTPSVAGPRRLRAITRLRPRGGARLIDAGAGLVVFATVACAIFGTAIAPYPPDAQDLALGVIPPGQGHLLGTDELGRDILSRVIVGAQTATIGPLAVALGALAIGSVLGLVAGYYGGRLDMVISRWVDLMFAIPMLLVAIVVVGVVGGGYWLAVLVITLLSAPYDTRMIRGLTLEQRGRPYIEAAQVLGVPVPRILFVHIWPVILPVIIANTCLNFGYALINLAALSFLGLGSDPGTPDWGRMIAENRTILFDNPWATLGPAIALVLLAASMALLGDKLSEWLADRGRAR